MTLRWHEVSWDLWYVPLRVGKTVKNFFLFPDWLRDDSAYMERAEPTQ